MLLQHVWALMGFPCGKYLTVMLGLWLPLLQEAGDLAMPFATPATIAELEAMSPATIDRYLAPARDRMRLRGISTTTPASSLLRNSIGLSKAGDKPPTEPGVIEADTVAYCGPTFAGEFALLNELWQLVSLRLNFFTPTKKPVGYATTADGRRKRLYDTPATPWQRVLGSGLLTEQQRAAVAAHA